MRPVDLRSFLARLEQEGDLLRVKTSVDPDLEIATIVDRVCKDSVGSRALLFEDVKGHSIPVAVNLFGSRQRMLLSLGVDNFEDLARRVQCDLVATGERCSARALQRQVACAAYRHRFIDGSKNPLVDVTGAGLTCLPALKSWPGDGGRYLTLGQVLTMHPETEETNCGMYRVQLLDRHKALLRCLPGSGGDRHLKAWHERGLPMPVTIALGGPPALTWAASVSLPDGVDEMDYVGYLSGEPVPMLRCQCSELAAPAAAEIIIEGKIWPAEEQLEGPFGNHTGSYSPAVPAPVIRVEKVLIRPEAIYPCTVVGPPPMENIYLAQATQQMLLPLLQHDHPWVMDVHMPVEGIFHRAAMVVVDSDCSWSLDQIRSALVTSMLLKKSKLIILLDEDVPRGSLRHVYWHIVNKMKCTKDADGVLIDARTPSGWSRVVQDPDLVASVNKRWSEFGL